MLHYRGPNLIHHPAEWITSQMLCYREDQIADIMLRSGSDLKRWATERTQSQRRVDQISDATLQRTKSHTSSCRVDHISDAMLQRGPNRRYHAAEWIRSQTLCYREDPISEKSGSDLRCYTTEDQISYIILQSGSHLRCYATEDQISYIILQSGSHLRCYATEDQISYIILQSGSHLRCYATERIKISDIMLRSGSDLKRCVTERTQYQSRVNQVSDATLQRTKSHTSSCRVDHISGSMLQRGPNRRYSLIARFIGPTWGSSGADRTQVGPMLAPWTLLSGLLCGVEQISDHNLHFILISDLIFAKHKRHPYAILGSWNKFTNDGEQGCYFKWRVQQD